MSWANINLCSLILMTLDNSTSNVYAVNFWHYLWIKVKLVDKSCLYIILYVYIDATQNQYAYTEYKSTPEYKDGQGLKKKKEEIKRHKKCEMVTRNKPKTGTQLRSLLSQVCFKSKNTKWLS